MTTPTPEPLAAPGAYGGWTAQNERLTFDVLADGRTVGAIRVERLTATCTPPLAVVVEPSFLAAYPIASDGTFTATFGPSTISGRFSEAGATGTLSYSSSAAAPYVCSSGNVSWTASSPPSPLPSALPGSYCGSTAQGRGVCLTLASNRRVTSLRIEAQLDCVFQGERAQFEADMGFARASVPLRSNLSFEVSGSIEGNAAGEYFLRGTFGAGDKVSGTLSLFQTSYDDQEGRLYTCKNASFGWQASRVG